MKARKSHGDANRNTPWDEYATLSARLDQAIMTQVREVELCTGGFQVVDA